MGDTTGRRKLRRFARVRQTYHACGCGRDLVLGSLFTTDQFDLKPRERINMALSAAAEFSAGVRAPFQVVSATFSGDAA